MTFVLILSLAFVIIALLIWVFKLKKSLKEHSKIAQELQYEAGHDDLTNLANASLAIDRLNQAIKNASRYKQKIAIIYLKIDYFKQINNTSGFDIDNELLQIVSQKLLEATRKNDTVARVNTEEFVIILEEIKDTTCIEPIVEKILCISQEVFNIQHHQISLNLNIGISIYPDDNADSMLLLSHAQTAMNLSKQDSSKNYSFYNFSLAEEAFKNESFEYELVESLKNEEIHLFYEFQKDTKNNENSSLEIFAGWRHPTMGLLFHEEFTHLAHEIGFLREIEVYTLDNILKEIQEWDKESSITHRIQMRISLKRFQEDAFMQTLLEFNEKYSFLKSSLSFTLINTKDVYDFNTIIKNIELLTQLGISFSMEAFKDKFLCLNLESLVINSTLIQNMEKESVREEIKSIIAIAKGIHLKIQAKGVQTQEQADFLIQNSCFNQQGSLYHKAQSLDNLNS